jgi:pimeloyl-ACP methyl ester carboxylesterase
VDASSGPAGYVVVSDTGDRIHFLDWDGSAMPGIVLVHGLSSTAWSWAPIARRVAGMRRTVAMDLRGHGLSDAPTGRYEPATLAADVIAVAEGSGALDSAGVVLAGHGFGGIVAAWAAAALGERCRRLVLVDGGWEDIAASTGMEPDEFLRGLDEPPEVLRSMAAYLGERAGFDPATWDADQEVAARAAVVETSAGRLVPATRPHSLAACVEAMFGYRPAATLPQVRAPIVALAATSPPPGTGLPPIEVSVLEATGHNLMRYRPDEVTAAILDQGPG